MHLNNDFVMFKMLYRMGQRPLCDTRCYNESKTKVKKGMREEGQRKRRGTVVGKNLSSQPDQR